MAPRKIHEVASLILKEFEHNKTSVLVLKWSNFRRPVGKQGVTGRDIYFH